MNIFSIGSICDYTIRMAFLSISLPLLTLPFISALFARKSHSFSYKHGNYLSAQFQSSKEFSWLIIKKFKIVYSKITLINFT